MWTFVEMVVQDILMYAEEYNARKIIIKDKRYFYLVVDGKEKNVAAFTSKLLDVELEYIVNELKRNGLKVEVRGDES